MQGEDNREPDDQTRAECYTFDIWIEKGVFPVECRPRQVQPLPGDRYFREFLERFWCFVLRDGEERERYRGYQSLHRGYFLTGEFVSRLFLEEVEMFLTAAGIDWQTQPEAPTCHHQSCHYKWRADGREWSRPTGERTRVWLHKALYNRLVSEAARFLPPEPGLPSWGLAPEYGPVRPLPWEEE